MTSWFRTIKTVAWSFVGLRNGKEFHEETQKINPVHLVVVGVAGAGLRNEGQPVPFIFL